LKLCSLGSGSRGNALVVDISGVRILIDAGLSHKQLVMRALRRDIYPRSIQATLLSHGHIDHVRGGRLWLGSNGGPVYGTRPTLVAAAIDGHMGAERIHTRQMIPLSETVEVQALPCIHNAVEPVTFAVTDHDTEEKLVMIFETGRATDAMLRELETATVLAVESNHDPEMLADNEKIPEFLMQRIRATHLSNGAAAEVIRQIPARCKMVMLLHLSRDNNAPGLACNIARRALAEIGRLRDVRLVIAEQDEPTEVLEI
jgi:phosphoribosyl 1,2-cyclic phosphodiesterase